MYSIHAFLQHWKLHFQAGNCLIHRSAPLLLHTEPASTGREQQTASVIFPNENYNAVIIPIWKYSFYMFFSADFGSDVKSYPFTKIDFSSFLREKSQMFGIRIADFLDLSRYYGTIPDGFYHGFIHIFPPECEKVKRNDFTSSA